MPVDTPSPEQWSSVAKQCGLSLSDADVASFSGLLAGFVDAYKVVDGLPDEVPPVKYPRDAGRKPGAEENTHNAWYRKTSIKGAPDGKLKGSASASRTT